jgi:hypothetical protein
MGPGPLGTNPASANSGRIAAVAAHPTDPDTIYIAAAGGGVWKTTNGGTHWDPLTDTQATLSMSAIAIAPSNPLVIYAGTGEANNSDSNFGRGILKSIDGGANWTLLTNGGAFDRRSIARIAVDPTNADTVYAAVAWTSENGLRGNTGIWKSTNGGLNWTNTTAVIDSSAAYTDVQIDPNNTGTLYTAIGDFFGASKNGVYKSVNGGGNWSLLTGVPSGTVDGRITLALSKSNSNVVYVSISGTGQPGSSAFGRLFKMMRSDTGGTSWTDLTAGTPNYMADQGYYDTTLIVDPLNSAIVYAGGAAGPVFGQPPALIRSIDSGAHWSDISSGGSTPHADHHGIAFTAAGKLLDGDDGGLYRLDNTNPVTWTDLNGDLNTIQFEGIALHPTNPDLAIGGSQDNGTERFVDNLAWTKSEGGDGGLVKYSRTNPNRVYRQSPPESFGTGFFRRSDDGGVNWVTKTSSLVADANNQNFYAPFGVDPGNGDRVLYGTNRVWETTTGGDSWAPISPVLAGTATLVDAIGLAASDVNTVYASFGGQYASSSRVFVTTDRGANWFERNLPAGSGRVAGLEVDPTNAQVAYAVVSNFGSGHVFRTADGGGTWTNVSGDLPNLPTWSFHLDPTTGTLYAGNDDGVYASSNGGTTWSRFGTQLPHAQVFQIDLNSTLRTLGAGTHGRGLWEIWLNTPPVVAPPSNQSGTEGASGTFTLGSFVDPDSSPYQVDVDWGDGSAHTTFSQGTAGDLGSQPHVYAEEGTQTVTVTVTNSAGQSDAKTFQITVSDPAVVGANVDFAAQTGIPFTGQAVATFTDPGGAEPNDSTHYTAVIDWGDTGTSPGTITGPDGNGTFTVSGDHTYTLAGTYTVTTTINHEGVITVVTSTATVTDPGGGGGGAPPPPPGSFPAWGVRGDPVRFKPLLEWPGESGTSWPVLVSGQGSAVFGTEPGLALSVGNSRACTLRLSEERTEDVPAEVRLQALHRVSNQWRAWSPENDLLTQLNSSTERAKEDDCQSVLLALSPCSQTLVWKPSS